QWALSQLKGALSEKIDLLRERLISILAELEASIDFSDEGISFGTADEVGGKIGAVRGEVVRLLSEYEEGRQVREGFTVAIIGRPNVGKSSLMNSLLKEERAIVTPYPGTTRDVLKEWVELDGFTIRLVDTAGYRKTDHPIEQEGVRRGEAAEREADLTIWVVDSSEPLRGEDEALAARLKGKRKIILLNKIDRPAQIHMGSIQQQHPSDPVVAASAVTGEGLPCLRGAMREFLTPCSERERPVVALVRHRNALERVKEGLGRAMESVRDGLPGEFVVVDLRDASDALGEIVGATATEEILDQIFSQFCIGK
ncbi:MAG: tRNA modification GTPase, partial [Nitrospiria bacterium]